MFETFHCLFFPDCVGCAILSSKWHRTPRAWGRTHRPHSLCAGHRKAVHVDKLKARVPRTADSPVSTWHNFADEQPAEVDEDSTVEQPDNSQQNATAERLEQEPSR